MSRRKLKLPSAQIFDSTGVLLHALVLNSIYHKSTAVLTWIHLGQMLGLDISSSIAVCYSALHLGGIQAGEIFSQS